MDGHWMKNGEYRAWMQAVEQIDIPVDGMSLDRFATAMKIGPSHATHAADYLHRRKKVWKSVQGGHVRIFPAQSNGRGRPAKRMGQAASLMPAKVVALLIDMTPTVATVAILLDRMPKGGWQDDPTLQAEIRRSVEVEARTMCSMFRGFIERAGFPVTMVRSYMWMAIPRTVMTAVAEIEPDLAEGDAPLTVIAPAEPKKLRSNLPPDERVHAYVEAAGVFGIGAYEIATKTGGAIKRDQVIDIATMLEASGFLYMAEARASSRGPKGVRLYAMKHGKPLIGSDGRRIPPLSMAS
jgi:hypothetical protein